MSSDFRIEIGFVGHRKTRRLIAAAGFEAFYSLIALWDYAARERSSGKLDNMDEFDIESEAMWHGQPGRFVATLLDEKIRFIERDPETGCYILHDWEVHQPYVITAPQRKMKAQLAANKRWGKPLHIATDNATSIKKDATSNAKRIKKDAPSLPPSLPPSLLPTSSLTRERESTKLETDPGTENSVPVLTEAELRTVHAEGSATKAWLTIAQVNEQYERARDFALRTGNVWSHHDLLQCVRKFVRQLREPKNAPLRTAGVSSGAKNGKGGFQFNNLGHDEKDYGGEV